VGHINEKPLGLVAYYCSINAIHLERADEGLIFDRGSSSSKPIRLMVIAKFSESHRNALVGTGRFTQRT
jgi:hypothetical protein